MELFLTLFGFATLLINLEIYTAIGRYFYEQNKIEDKIKLISSGFCITLLFSLIILVLLFCFKYELLHYYIRNVDQSAFYTIGVFYVFFNALSTYLSVIPRYDNKARVFTLVNSLAAVIKMASILFFLIILEYGLISIILGHLVQAIFSTICYLYVSKNYLKPIFDFSKAAKLIEYALPLVPFVVLIGFWEPFSRHLLVDYFSKSELGLLNFVIRLATLLELVNYAVHMTWMPLLYENKDSVSFKSDVVHLSKKISILILLSIILISLIAPEIVFILRATEFSQSILIINLLLLASYFKIMVRLRGYLPYINNKTYILTIAQVISYVFGILFLYMFKNSFGIVGMAVFVLLPFFMNYIILLGYTALSEKISFFSFKELLLLILCFVLTAFHSWNDSLFLRYAGVSVVLFVLVKYFDVITQIRKFKSSNN